MGVVRQITYALISQLRMNCNLSGSISMRSFDAGYPCVGGCGGVLDVAFINCDTAVTT